MLWFMRYPKEIQDDLANLQTFFDNWRSDTMAAFDNLKREIEETKGVNLSVIALLQGLKAKLDEAIASNDPAVLQALADSLDVEQQSLANAITANTPPVGPGPGPAPAPDVPPL